jgi:hypothetical protein
VKPFFSPARVWPSGQRVLELYVLPDLRRDHELATLARELVLDELAVANMLLPAPGGVRESRRRRAGGVSGIH